MPSNRSNSMTWHLSTTGSTRYMTIVPWRCSTRATKAYGIRWLHVVTVTQCGHIISWNSHITAWMASRLWYLLVPSPEHLMKLENAPKWAVDFSNQLNLEVLAETSMVDSHSPHLMKIRKAPRLAIEGPNPLSLEVCRKRSGRCSFNAYPLVKTKRSPLLDVIKQQRRKIYRHSFCYFLVFSLQTVLALPPIILRQWISNPMLLISKETR